MSIGLLARADATGLGYQSRDFHRHLNPAKTLIVDLAGQSASGKDLTAHPDWFPHGEVSVVSGIPTDADLESWLNGLQAVFTMETPYNYRLYDLARQRGIRTVLQGNWEFLDYLRSGDHQSHPPDVLALPSTWNLVQARRLLGDRMLVIHLPFPVPADVTPAAAPAVASRFVHAVGNPAIHDRNGTHDVLAALRHVKSAITVTLVCQRPGYLESVVDPSWLPANVSLVISPPVEDRRDLYAGQHAQVLPRRYGGLCLPLNEAIAAGIPTLMPAVHPNTDWLPTDWLTPATVEDSFLAKTIVDIHRSDPQALAARIDVLATDERAYGAACRQARRLAQQYSWDSLLPEYLEVL